MIENRRKSVVQGAGLGFLLSAIVFVITWSPLAFLAVLAGAAAGFLLSLRPVREERLSEKSAPVGEPGILARWLAHPRLPVRFACLLALGSLLFVTAWAAGYYLLEEGALRSGAQAHLEARQLGGQAGSAFAEGARLFLNNLIPFVLLVAANRLMRVNGIPLGYVVPLYNLLLYGLFVGSNSFLIPYPERMAPSLAILGRAGPYEMAAFLLAAAASARWPVYEVRRLFRTTPERTAERSTIRAAEVLALVLALLLLAGAAFLEGWMITIR